MLLESAANRQIARIGVDTSADTKAVISMNAKAFKVLSSTIYANKIGSMVRELYCNAVDSHADAGKSGVPGVIHLPSAIEPYFSVQDFGIGMDDNTVRQVYMGYFNSTKDGDNSKIGAFGLGSKTPFAYTDAFTVRSVKDGIARSYAMFLSESGEPTVSLVAEDSVTEGNGVTVTVPVTDTGDFNVFKNEVVNQLKFMPVNPIVENGIVKFPELISGSSITGEGYIVNSPVGDIWVVQGGVGYNITNNLISYGHPMYERFCHLRNIGTVIHVNIGDVEVTASREDVEYTKRTKELLLTRIDEIFKDLKTNIVEKIDAVEHFWDFANIESGMRNMISLTGAKDSIKDIVTNRFADSIDYIVSSYGHADCHIKLSAFVPNMTVTLKDDKGQDYQSTVPAWLINGLYTKENRNGVLKASTSQLSAGIMRSTGIDRANTSWVFCNASLRGYKRYLNHLVNNVEELESPGRGEVFFIMARDNTTYADFVKHMESKGFSNFYNLAEYKPPVVKRGTSTADRKKYTALMGYYLTGTLDRNGNVSGARGCSWERIGAEDMEDIDDAYIIPVDASYDFTRYKMLGDPYFVPALAELDKRVIIMREENIKKIEGEGEWLDFDTLERDSIEHIKAKPGFDDYCKAQSLIEVSSKYSELIPILDAISKAKQDLPTDLEPFKVLLAKVDQSSSQAYLFSKIVAMDKSLIKPVSLPDSKTVQEKYKLIAYLAQECNYALRYNSGTTYNRASAVLKIVLDNIVSQDQNSDTVNEEIELDDAA